MRGTILGVHDGRGVLLAADERRMEFPLTEWRSAGVPTPGQVVDFIEDGGQARAVFAVPGLYASASAATGRSGAFILGAVALGCLALGFLIPVIPTVAAFVLGVIGAGQAQAERDETALLMSRIAWIGALVLIAVGFLLIVAVVGLVGAFGWASLLEFY